MSFSLKGNSRLGRIQPLGYAISALMSSRRVRDHALNHSTDEVVDEFAMTS